MSVRGSVLDRSRRSREVAGVDLGGRGDSPVCGGDDLVGEVDQSASGRLWQRDSPIGSDLAARGPGDAFVARLTLLDRDLGLALGSHSDDARGSGKAGVVGRSVADDVGDVDRCHHAEMKALTAAGRLTRVASWSGVAQPPWLLAAAAIAERSSLAAPTNAGSVRLAGLVSSPQRFAALLQATWLASRRSQPLHHIVVDMALVAAASVMTLVVLVMSACTRAIRTKSAGSGLAARVRCA